MNIHGWTRKWCGNCRRSRVHVSTTKERRMTCIGRYASLRGGTVRCGERPNRILTNGN